MQPPSSPPSTPMAAMPSMITTEQIQKFLDENKQLILAILDSQNSGKMSECAQYQAQLQKNLLFLAAVADAQSQAVAVRQQMMPHGAIPEGGRHGQQQQQPFFPPRDLLQFNPQQMQEQEQQSHHQPQGMAFPGQMGERCGDIDDIQDMHFKSSHGSNANAHTGFLANIQGNNEGLHSGSAAANLAAMHGQRSLETEL